MLPSLSRSLASASSAVSEVTAAASVRSADDYGADASTGSDVVVLQLGWGQALLTLGLVVFVIGLVMGLVWYRHRAQGEGAPFSFNLPSLSLPSFRRGRTFGGGAVGGGAADGDGRSERLLGGAAADDSSASALRNRPGGHSLL